MKLEPSGSKFRKLTSGGLKPREVLWSVPQVGGLPVCLLVLAGSSGFAAVCWVFSSLKLNDSVCSAPPEHPDHLAAPDQLVCL